MPNTSESSLSICTLIGSTISRTDDSVPHDPKTPSNSASIADANRIGRLAQEENAHDASVEASRQRVIDREAQRAKDLEAAAQNAVPEGAEPMMNAAVLGTGGGQNWIGGRIPSNQVSMEDDLSKTLENLFLEKVPSPREETVQANQERRESIQREAKQDDRSWEKVDTPTSTKSIQEALEKAWMPPEPALAVRVEVIAL